MKEEEIRKYRKVLWDMEVDGAPAEAVGLLIVWLRECEVKHEARQPTEDDLRYAVAADPHLALVASGVVPVLDPMVLVEGSAYRLSNGQRAVLRERYDLTPTQEVIVERLSFYPGSRAVEEVVLASRQHVPDSNRRHVLTKCTISDFGRFMRLSRESEETAVKASAGTQKGAVKVSKKQQEVEDILNQY